MKTFSSVREAKDFLVSRIVQEAEHEGIPLSQPERKMMYFSETAWTLPDMAGVSDVFDRGCDQTEYEEKIGTLARNFLFPQEQPKRFNSWMEAVRTIRGEDHYLLVLVSAGGSSGRSQMSFLELLAIGIGITCVIFAIAYVVLTKP